MIFLCVRVCVCVLQCLYWLVIVDSWRDIIFLCWFVCYLCEKLRSLPNWRGGADPWDVKDKWGEPGNERWRWGGDKRVEELSDDGERKLGKGGWWGGGRKMERGGALIHLKTSISHRPVSAQTCSDRPRTSWSRGHWIVLAISFISRHCNALDCVDK